MAVAELNGVAHKRAPDPAPEPPDLAAVAEGYKEVFAASKGDIKGRLRLVTPAQAGEWLAENAGNRPMSETFAARYAAAMRGGEWQVNGSPVVFDVTGRLADGQHRLKGVVLAGVAVPMVVVEGVPEGTFQTLDVGRKRSFGQYLRADGEKNATCLAAAVFWLRVLVGHDPAGGRAASVADQYAVLERNPDLRASASAMNSYRKNRVFEPGPFAALHYLASAVHPEVAAKFFDQLFTGENVTKADAAYWLREQLHVQGPRRLSPLHKMAIAVKAFNAAVAGKSVKVLRWSENEEFPALA